MFIAGLAFGVLTYLGLALASGIMRAGENLSVFNNVYVREREKVIE